MAAGDTYQKVGPYDQWIFNAAGQLVGVRSPHANGGDLYFDAANLNVTGGVLGGLATLLPLTTSSTGAQNAATFASTVNAAGGYALPRTGDFALASSDLPADSALIGNENARLRTSPTTGSPWGLRLPQGQNNQLIDRLKMLPAAGATTHDGVASELMNGVMFRQPAITGYTGGCSISWNNGTAMRIDGGQFGNASDVALSVTGATNDSVVTAATIAYPKYGGYFFGPGGQANSVIGGETAVQDGGVPIIIDRSNSFTLQGHNTESQATGGTPAAFIVVGCGPAMVASVAVNAAGSGYTDGIYPLTASGGTGLPPMVRATVTGGVVVSAQVKFPGYGIGTGWTLTMPAASGGTGATFTTTLGTTTGTHNTHIKNHNIIANKGNVTDSIVVQSPFFGMVVDGIRINATKITGSIIKLNTVNGFGVFKDINVSGRPGGVVDLQIAPDATYLPSGISYTFNLAWDFHFNKGTHTLLAGPQARSSFPTTGRKALHYLEIANDPNIAPYGDWIVQNGITLFRSDFTNGQLLQGNGVDTVQPYRHYGPLSADPTTLTDGDSWFRTDTFQYCYRTDGVTKRSAAFT